MTETDTPTTCASAHGTGTWHPQHWATLSSNMPADERWCALQASHAVAPRRRAWLAAALLCAAPLAHADCFEEAAGYQHVNPWVLRAIAWQESRGRADAIHRNNNGTIDYGKMQINSIHLRRLSSYGISRDALMQPCVSVYVAAWRLREMTNKYGNTCCRRRLSFRNARRARQVCACHSRDSDQARGGCRVTLLHAAVAHCVAGLPASRAQKEVPWAYTPRPPDGERGGLIAVLTRPASESPRLRERPHRPAR